MAERKHTHAGKAYRVSEAHPVADLFPWMEEAELDALAEDVRRNGQRQPIVQLPDSRIVDGRNRELACRIAGVEPEYKVLPGNISEEKIVARIISANLKRRHLDASQRAMLAAKFANMRPGDNQHTEVASREATSQEAAAEQFDSSRASVQRARTVLHKAPELVAPVESGKLDVHTAAKAAALPPEEREEIATAPDPKAAAKLALAATEEEAPEEPADPIDLAGYDLFETFGSLVETDEEEGGEPAAPAKRLPKHFQRGNKLDPNHPFYAVLTGISALSATITKAIAADESGRLKAYLTHVQLAKPVLPALVRHRMLVVEGKHYDAQFVGLKALRRLVFLAGKGAKPLAAKQVIQAFTKAGQEDAEGKAA